MILPPTRRINPAVILQAADEDCPYLLVTSANLSLW